MSEAKLKAVADALWSQGKRWATREPPKGQLSRWSSEKWSQHICDVLFKELDAEQKKKVRHELRALLRSAAFRRLVGDLQIEERAQFLNEFLQEFK